jgi:hypothetical protein
MFAASKESFMRVNLVRVTAGIIATSALNYSVEHVVGMASRLLIDFSNIHRAVKVLALHMSAVPVLVASILVEAHVLRIVEVRG